MGDAGRPTSRRERLPAELERDVLTAARRLIATEGIEVLSLSAVAREVGVTPSALYRYFEGKPGLTLAVYEAVTRDFVPITAEAAGAAELEEFGGQLYAATRAVLDWSVANPGEFDLLMGAGYARLARLRELRRPGAGPGTSGGLLSRGVEVKRVACADGVD
ncbi:TetR/AcrR family transcriptional regulator [Streptomyces sp. NPDC056831]|uniref:TetR/AcrR family transcriptional regulator n=1 Tax=Streptomyces sp. NPDC056831 TaxID=3345954 RepID=UPI00367A35A2